MNAVLVAAVAVCSVLLMTFFIIDSSQLSQLGCGSQCNSGVRL